MGARDSGVSFSPSATQSLNFQSLTSQDIQAIALWVAWQDARHSAKATARVPSPARASPSTPVILHRTRGDLKSLASPWRASGLGSAWAPAAEGAAGRPRDPCTLAHAQPGHLAIGGMPAPRSDPQPRWHRA